MKNKIKLNYLIEKLQNMSNSKVILKEDFNFQSRNIKGRQEEKKEIDKIKFGKILNIYNSSTIEDFLIKIKNILFSLGLKVKNHEINEDNTHIDFIFTITENQYFYQIILDLNLNLYFTFLQNSNTKTYENINSIEILKNKIIEVKNIFKHKEKIKQERIKQFEENFKSLSAVEQYIKDVIEKKYNVISSKVINKLEEKGYIKLIYTFKKNVSFEFEIHVTNFIVSTVRINNNMVFANNSYSENLFSFDKITEQIEKFLNTKTVENIKIKFNL